MRIRRTFSWSIVVAALSTLPAVVAAQASTPPRKPTTPVIAGIAQSPESSRDHDHGRDSDRRDGDRRRNDGDGIRVGHVFFGPEVPVVVGSDGHVYANFGYGFQPVLQNCATDYQSLSAAPTAAGPMQPGVTQPVVAQPGTTPQGSVSTRPQESASAVRLGEAPSAMCWSTDEGGKLRVGRRSPE